MARGTNGSNLTRELARLLASVLLPDLRARAAGAVGRALDARYHAERKAARTAEHFEGWRDRLLEQIGAAWILSCLFVRTLEDRDLLDRRRIVGEGAADSEQLFFELAPNLTAGDYLLTVFRELARLPGAQDVLGPKHNLAWRLSPSNEAARALLDFFRATDESGRLRWTFDGSDTRFLGDVYQDLSESARERYALFQTPMFVADFLLDYTLEPGIREFGLTHVRLIDPTCGSGHLLLDAFDRLVEQRLRAMPGRDPKDHAREALGQIHGVDINPYAIAIARFRLTVAFLDKAGIRKLGQSPRLPLNLAVADSLLHGVRGTSGRLSQIAADTRAWGDELFRLEDAAAAQRILEQAYHVVVGNPPYVTVKDTVLNRLYRDHYKSCSGKYHLSVPFMERFFELALPARGCGEGLEGDAAGFVGLITDNAFTKRSYGKKLVEECIPHWDLTHAIDTSSAGPSLEGHGTPTVILFGRNRSPTSAVVRAVMGIRSEKETYPNCQFGPGWSAILAQIDHNGSESEFVSVADTPRERFHEHPWNMGGGGAADLKEWLDEHCDQKLEDVVDLVGVFGMTNADEVMIAPQRALRRRGVERAVTTQLVIGDQIRDWGVAEGDWVLFPYRDEALLPITEFTGYLRYLWPAKTVLGNRATFAKLTYFKENRPWWEWHQVTLERLRSPLSIVFAFFATHNHFVLDRGGNVFKQSSPVIKLPAGAIEDDHLALLGLLNSSVGCFWMKQQFFDRGSGGIGGGIASENWEKFYEHDATKMRAFPVSRVAPISIAQAIDSLAAELNDLRPSSIGVRQTPSAELRRAVSERAAGVLGRIVAMQEELDWECYRLYGLLLEEQGAKGDAGGEVPVVRLGERAFEIVMARKMANGALETTWFERHGSKPITEVPASWPEWYRKLVERRIATIESSHNIALIEQPEYKRRWNTEPWEEQERHALRCWLLERLEDPRNWSRVELITCRRLADRVRQDTDFVQVAELYTGSADVDVAALVSELVESEAVPFLPVLRYKPSGLAKRALWEQTWDLQRREDAGENVGTIPVPPKYLAEDFICSTCSRLRGQLDVPKECFISYPGAEGDDDRSLVIGWAGWDHLQQARALAALYEQRKRGDGWGSERLAPLLAGLLELVPWLKQWHNEPDPEFEGERLGDYFERLVDGEARALGLSLDDVRGWKAERATRRPRGRKSA